MKQTVFWDFDGTLVYCNQSFLDALQQALQEKQCETDRECCARFLQEASSWNHPEESYIGRTGECWWTDLQDKIKIFLDSIHVSLNVQNEICEMFRKNAISYSYHIYEDATEILEKTKRNGVSNYIISNNFPELIQTIEKMGISRYFEDVFLSANIGYEKPRAEIFQYALQQTGQPEMAYMVGDNPAADIQGAAAVGMRTIMVHGTAPVADAEYTCRSLIEIQDILQLQ